MMARAAKSTAERTAAAQCACGAVRLEIVFPAFWAWHDHTPATRRAHGAAYATYVGTWRSRLRIASGEDEIASYNDGVSIRQFCRTCGTPLIYERRAGAKMVNIPRALFAARTGREPRYHLGFEERPDWGYREERLVPLKGYAGWLWTGGRSTPPEIE